MTAARPNEWRQCVTVEPDKSAAHHPRHAGYAVGAQTGYLSHGDRDIEVLVELSIKRATHGSISIYKKVP
jgi:hypothetical protein